MWDLGIWVRSRNCGCLVTWFCYQLIAKPGNKTAAASWPDPYTVLDLWSLLCSQISQHQSHHLAQWWLPKIGHIFLQICHWLSMILNSCRQYYAKHLTNSCKFFFFNFRYQESELTMYLPKWFRHKLLHLFVALHNKAQGGELTTTITDQLICQHVGEDFLQT